MEADGAHETRRRLLAGEPLRFSASAPVADRTIPADWLAEAVRAGAEVHLESACITGRLDLRNAQVRTDFRVVASEFRDFVDLSYAELARALRLSRCIFHRGASFDSTHVRSDTWLDGTVFDASGDAEPEPSSILFNDAEFAGVLVAQSVKFAAAAPASFQRARFKSLVLFDHAQFDGESDFSHARFEGSVAFDRACFRRPCTLYAARIHGAATFTDARFARRAHLSLFEAQVGGNLLLTKATFLGWVNGGRVRIDGSIEGAKSVFAGGVNLRDAAVTGSVDLTGTRAAARFLADLRGLSVNELDLSAALLKGPVDLRGAVVRRTLTAKGTRFRRRAGLGGIAVSGDLDATGAWFRQGVSLEGSRLGALLLLDARSFGTLDCAGMTVAGSLSLTSARVRARGVALNLQGVDVERIAFFEKARFAGRVTAIGLKVGQQLSWNDVVTTQEVDFYELEVKRGMFVKGAAFGGPLILDRARLNADVFFAATRCYAKASFVGADIAGLYLGRQDAPYDRAAVFCGGIALMRCRLGDLSLGDVSVAPSERRTRSTGTTADSADPTEPVASFHLLEVSGAAHFIGASFGVPANFYGAIFGGEAQFQRAHFGDHEVTSFRGCTFRRGAHFFGTRFDAEADFSYARFENEASFRAWFRKRASFDFSRFLGPAEFSEPRTVSWSPDDPSWVEGGGSPPGSAFGDTSFVQARFAGDVRFDAVRFDGELDLREATFATLYLPNDADERTESELLPRTLKLVGCRYERIALRHPHNLLEREARRWRGSRLRDPHYDRQPFTQLENTLRRGGDERAADRVYLAGRRAERRQKPPTARFMDGCYGVLVNYGVRPWRLVVLAFVLLAAGSWFFSHSGTVEAKDKTQRGQSPSPVTWEVALNMSLAQFLPVPLAIKEHLVPASHPVSVALSVPGSAWKFVVQIRPTSIASVLQVAGWILVPVGLAAMTGVLMRKGK